MYAQRCGRSSYTDCRVFKLERRRTPPGPVRGNPRTFASLASNPAGECGRRVDERETRGLSGPWASSGARERKKQR
ncbi:hypothetical protein K0M31_004402 [Melipona bicolor]|uniref:Uncharacterized protein n=1 Tax=Melipona bicolor TaxID=60889 RepID=A0AA40FWP7_9HYME|nr:hypothetical protein K0M31_004402 [Melipona bicolor]